MATALVFPAIATASPEPAAGVDATTLDAVTVTATRNERALAEVPATVSVLTREELDRQLARDIKDLVRYEPGVSVTSSFGRFGLGGFRIRGLDGNRVLIQTDGIPVSDAFSIGSFSNANRNFVDLDTLKAVEIVRGPASALYGSDALGGVVSFVTKDPEDYLGDDGDSHIGLKFGYQGDTRGLFTGATGAWAGERWSGLLAVGGRKGQETDNMGEDGGVGAGRTRPNPQDSRGKSLLAKLVFDPAEDHRFRLTVEGNEDRVDTDVLTAVSALTRSLSGEDLQTRARLSLQHEWWGMRSPLMDSLEWQLYRQDSQTVQDTFEARGNGTLRQRRFDFDQRLYGLEMVARKAVETGQLDHDLTWGLELTRTEVRQKRDGLAIDPATGIATPVVPPDVFPVRDFPISTVTGAALFLQDEIRFGDGRLRLVPGLRIDRFELDPEPDAIFDADNPGIAVAGLSDTAVSPKLGLVRDLGAGWSLYAGYAHGFRAPPYSDVNLGFTNLAFGYTAIPNPDLKPEKSRGYELGLRHRGDYGWLQLAAYRNDYEDFIESLVFLGFNQQGLMVFQSRNLSRARIQGAEFKAGLDLALVSDALEGWSLRAAASWQHGDDRTSGEPLRSVDPARAVLGLAYEAELWGVELVGNFARRKDRLADLSPGQPAFAPPGYGVLDLLAHWNFAPGASLDIGLFNLTDRRYWDWADVPGVAADSPVLDRYTRPGRHAALSLRLQW
ncbi:TonB-dependent hemoglobin/transferrin/lactoferrin family receptor [Arenimonas fontis]|uniref:TonB-dependent hemoglobin/transferrin/lactoferrin family receptor n=1 Tax=Arenimonas fontis TaxID=2608255 RepID=A0A5B2Z9Y5_9GAMM|nr:TonB-dependent hemoglobin/transferrin/lactoferrin family receptor [Arenimonas fontis]